ncbi:his operon leader peptide [Kosakonia cowanii]|nr:MULTISPECIES: his operon leader peptide [Kosakonia]AZI89728.1 his operon leader peptide [Kosakonia sp. CCTCC M2018092]MDF7760057.1 his operon leader peptide [Kosakonia cowanii]MDH2912654.1 his operon leader peptide [Kosakonia sp. HypNH10]
MNRVPSKHHHHHHHPD